MTKSILAAGVAALAVLTAGAAIAQQQVPQPGQHRAARGDADNDGRISRAEFVDARVARLTALDANRDGQISAEERQAAGQARHAERAETRFARLDKDGNGSISREEFAAPREPRADRGERMGRGERAGRHERRGHRAGFRNGRGHGGEWGPRAEARGPLTIADVQTRLTTRFDRIDTNRDGFLSAEERTAARQSMRAERQERRAARQAPAPASPSTSASE